MTKGEVYSLIAEFIDEQCDVVKDEWYTTEKDLAEYILGRFKEYVKDYRKDTIPF